MTATLSALRSTRDLGGQCYADDHQGLPAVSPDDQDVAPLKPTVEFPESVGPDLDFNDVVGAE